MRIAKALKLKNSLAGEVAELKELLAKQNMRPSKQPFDYNTEVLSKLRDRMNELIRTKAAVAVVNGNVFLRLGESVLAGDAAFTQLMMKVSPFCLRELVEPAQGSVDVFLDGGMVAHGSRRGAERDLGRFGSDFAYAICPKLVAKGHFNDEKLHVPRFGFRTSGAEVRIEIGTPSSRTCSLWPPVRRNTNTKRNPTTLSGTLSNA